MARVEITSWGITNLGDDNIRVSANIDITLTRTENRLSIPSEVHIRLFERDGDIDTTHLFADRFSFRPYKDNDESLRWHYVGSFSETTSTEVTAEFNIDDIREAGSEELYLVAASVPDIISDVAYSTVISYSNQSGTTWSTVEV